MRTRQEVLAEIEQVNKELKQTADNSPNVGHLMTILVGLKGELSDIEEQKEGEMVKFIKGSVRDLIDWGSKEDEVDNKEKLEEIKERLVKAPYVTAQNSMDVWRLLSFCQKQKEEFEDEVERLRVENAHLLKNDYELGKEIIEKLTNCISELEKENERLKNAKNS